MWSALCLVTSMAAVSSAANSCRRKHGASCVDDRARRRKWGRRASLASAGPAVQRLAAPRAAKGTFQLRVRAMGNARGWAAANCEVLLQTCQRGTDVPRTQPPDAAARHGRQTRPPDTSRTGSKRPAHRPYALGMERAALRGWGARRRACTTSPPMTRTQPPARLQARASTTRMSRSQFVTLARASTARRPDPRTDRSATGLHKDRTTTRSRQQWSAVGRAQPGCYI